jgi:hypothetical protein
MSTRRCCCADCKLGEDTFTRVDATPPSGRWYEIDGEWSLTDQFVTDNGTEGILATTICHPVAYDEGSWIANFRLMEVRSREKFIVRAGNPMSPAYEVWYEPLDMDLPNARIKITVVALGVEVSVEHPWPFSSILGGSADEVNAFACYQPGVMLRASIGSFGGLVPVAAICIGGSGSNCFTVSGVKVGNFSFIKGAFDDWQYWATAIDDLNCTPCGCYCLKGMKPEDRFEPERSCFPDKMKAIFQLVSSDVDAGACAINDFEIELNLFGNNRDTWLSGDASICTTTFAIKVNCAVFDEGDRIFRALVMELLNSAGNQTGSIALQWDNPDYDAGETPNIKFPDYDESTCEPLALVYQYATLRCFFGPCDVPGVSGFIPFCCPEVGCLPSCPTILYKVTLVAA